MIKKSADSGTKPSAVPSTASNGKSAGSRERPWVLKTPPGTSEFTAHRDEASDYLVAYVQSSSRVSDGVAEGELTAV
jgi:hypothetical protein